MAEIFVSYTSKDRDWAFWIGQELEKLGHLPRIDAWEISAGGNIVDWMEQRTDEADQMVLVISKAYLDKPYASWERRSAQWASRAKRPNFAVPIRIEDCELPILLDPLTRCDLFDIDESTAGARLASFMQPAARPSGPVTFPGKVVAMIPTASSLSRVSFPGAVSALSNIPISIPLHFVGRDGDLKAIDAALEQGGGLAAATAALHGLRGVGKTTLAAAYAERHKRDYRATWWIRAETESAMRADLFGLGVQLGWVAADMPEEAAVKAVLDRLRSEGDDILLVYDNATGPNEVSRYLPRGGKAHIVITSNAPNWGRVAVPVEIEVWSVNVGADFLIACTGRAVERDAACALSQVLGGLPLAHEQAAAYCERLGISLGEYLKRFKNAPALLLDVPQDVSSQYGMTVSKTFVLAIRQAAKRHPAAERVIHLAAALAPEPIPLFLFREAATQLRIDDGGILWKIRSRISTCLRGDFRPSADALDEAVAALRSFALADCESIIDERDPSVTTDCIRLHRLVREVVATQKSAGVKAAIRRDLIEATVSVYPRDVHRNSSTWHRARRLDAIAIELVSGDDLPDGSERNAANLLGRLESYRDGALAAYAEAQKIAERALAIREKVFGSNHPAVATSFNNIGYLLLAQGNCASARSYFERALAIDEKHGGPDHPDVAVDLDNLGSAAAALGDVNEARRLFDRALKIREKSLGPDHADTATSLNNIGVQLQGEGKLSEAQQYYERALTIRENVLGADHLSTALTLGNYGVLLHVQGKLVEARQYLERVLIIYEKVLGLDHPDTKAIAQEIAILFRRLGLLTEAADLRRKYGLKADE